MIIFQAFTRNQGVMQKSIWVFFVQLNNSP